VRGVAGPTMVLTEIDVRRGEAGCVVVVVGTVGMWSD